MHRHASHAALAAVLKSRVDRVRRRVGLGAFWGEGGGRVGDEIVTGEGQ